MIKKSSVILITIMVLSLLSIPVIAPNGREEMSASDMLIGFNIAENLLKEKIMFTLHIIKEEIFQAELKLIEMSLAQHPCTDQPLSFKISKKDYRYGKIEEIDSMINKLILIMRERPRRFGIDRNRLRLARNLLRKADRPQRIERNPRRVFNCKYWAYQALMPGKEVTIDDPDCFCDERCKFQQSCESDRDCGTGGQCIRESEPFCTCPGTSCTEDDDCIGQIDCGGEPIEICENNQCFCD